MSPYGTDQLGLSATSKSLSEWLESVSGTGWLWYLKRLSGNDTLANESHQYGPYVPKPVIFRAFPSLNQPDQTNPEAFFPVQIDSHGDERTIRAIWYNNRTRDEARITQWGGSKSPLLDPEATGSLVLFAFHTPERAADADLCRIWLCETVAEEELIESRAGSPIDPGEGMVVTAEKGPEGGTEWLTMRLRTGGERCRLEIDELPDEWTLEFPSGQEIIDKAVELSGIGADRVPDERILRRRECETELFYSVERAHVLPRIEEGFETVDEFVSFANSVTNRRKSRAGHSLELHARRVFDEEQLPYSHNEESEDGKKPDFLFPSADAYRNSRFPAEKLRMLGVKTTCKDRWRQVLDEAQRIAEKHLMTIQEGVSENQFQQMREAGLRLVVPSRLHTSYPDPVRPDLISVNDFIRQTEETVR